MRPEQVRRIRKRLGLTQEELAELIGVRRETVVRWENGQRGVPTPTARLLLRLIGERRREGRK